MSAGSASASAALELLTGAARLAHLMRHRKQDAELRAEGREIVYAVDTSVLQLLIAPEKGKPGLFFVRDESTLTALVSALSHFLFYRMQDAALFVIPPHDVEIVGVVSAIAGKANARARIELPEALLIAAKADASAEAVMKLLLAKAPTVLSALFGIGKHGPIQELERYLALLKRKRLKNVMRQAGFPVPEKYEWPRIDNRAADLYVALHKVKGITPKLQVMRDARVMAYIEWLNQHMTATVVHLIAYDNALASVCDQQLAAGQAHIVRDPRYFIAAGDAEAAGNIARWIDEVLLAICPRDKVYHQWLGEVVSGHADVPALDDEKTFQSLADLSDRIGHYVNEAGLKYWLTDSNAVDGGDGRMPSSDEAVLTYLRANYKELADILQQRIDETVREIDKLAVVAGFYLIADGDAEFSAVLKNLVDKEVGYFGVLRAPVWLRFEHIYDWTKQLHEALQGGANLRKAAAAFDWPGSDTRKQYEFRLVYAYLLSLRGHWDAAKIHCAHAMKLADESMELIDAYDAAYFRAVCLRHMARNVDEVQHAEDELDEAERRWNASHAGEADHDPRFKVEGLVQRFLKWEFRNARVLEGDATATEVDRVELKSVVRGMWNLWGDIEAEHSDSIRQSLAQQLFINVAEATCIEHLVLRGPTTVSLMELFERRSSLRERGLLVGETAPVFVRLILSLVDWMAAGDDVFQRGIAREDFRSLIVDYGHRRLYRHEEGLLRSFQRAVEPG